MELLLASCVSSDGHIEDVLCNVRGGMMILKIKLPILLHKLVTHTPHDMISNGLLPQKICLWSYNTCTNGKKKSNMLILSSPCNNF